MVNRITSRTYVDEYGVLYFDVAMEKDDGSVQEKRLCAEDYFQLFQKGTVAQEDFHEICRIPKEVAWAAQGSEPGNFRAVVMLPEKPRPVFFMGQIIEDVPFPALCAYVEAKKGWRTSTELFAVKELSLDAQLYSYPFGNVSRNTGSCCFGNIAVSGLHDASCAVKAVNAFLEGETNGDLWDRLGPYKRQGDLYEALKGKRKFPKRLLVKHYGTVRNLCR